LLIPKEKISAVISNLQSRFDFIPTPAKFGSRQSSRETFRLKRKGRCERNRLDCFKGFNHAAEMLPGEKGERRTLINGKLTEFPSFVFLEVVL